MRPQPEDSDLPDFLHNSPFLPLSADLAYSYPKHIPPPKPTLRQLLRSKTTRIAVLAFFSFITLLYLRSRFQKAHVYNRLTGPSCYYTPALTPPDDDYSISNPNGDGENVDWTKYAYVLYATDLQYLCNAVMVFETLFRMKSKGERVLMYPDIYSLEGREDSGETRLLLKAKDEYGVVLRPVKVQHVNSAYYSGPNWSDSYTKLLAFNQTQYNRIIVLDSDSTLLSPLDSLFFLPLATAIMPRAYWLHPTPKLSSHIMVLTPSVISFSMVEDAIKKARYGVYDMEIMNSIFGSTCSILPHREYALLSGEYRSGNHDNFLNLELNLGLSGEGREDWNPDKVINDAKLVHFSDHPLGKPWTVSEEDIEKAAPGCRKISGWEEECRTRDVWLDLYEDFRERRVRVCGRI